MASEKNKVLVRQAKGPVKDRGKGAVRKNLRSRNPAGELKQDQIEFSDVISRLKLDQGRMAYVIGGLKTPGELDEDRIEFPHVSRTKLKTAIQNLKTELNEDTTGPKQVTSATVRAHALEAFGNVEKANHWLRRPNQLFQGRSPLQVLEVDPAAVEAEIVRIEHGVYV